MVVGVGGAENAFYQGGSVFSLLGSLPFNLAFASSVIPAFLYSYNSRVNNKPLCTFEQPAFLGLIIITYTTFFLLNCRWRIWHPILEISVFSNDKYINRNYILIWFVDHISLNIKSNNSLSYQLPNAICNIYYLNYA